jgi:hypothetical protein
MDAVGVQLGAIREHMPQTLLKIGEADAVGRLRCGQSPHRSQCSADSVSPRCRQQSLVELVL